MDAQTTTPTTTTPTNKPKDKLIGYLLLAAGLIIIISTVIWAVYTFTGQIKPPQVFNVEAPSIPIPGSNLSLDTSSLPPEIAKSLNQTQAKPASFKILPDNVFSNMLNLGIFYLLAMFVASTGAKIASLGVQLIRDIKVEFKA